MNRYSLLAKLVACSLVALSLSAGATVIDSAYAEVRRTPDLAAGSQYRIAFVTSGGISATNTDISVYDSFVNGLANGSGSILAPLGSSWKAIVSTAGADAYSHIGGAFTIPVYSVDGHLIASNAADLWDGWLGYQIFTNEKGISGSVNVNTGTLTDGSRSPHPLGGDPIYNAITGGLAGATGWSWMVGSFEGKASIRPVYGISEALTVGLIPVVPVPVPEPETYAMMLAGLGLMGFMTRRRKS